MGKVMSSHSIKEGAMLKKIAILLCLGFLLFGCSQKQIETFQTDLFAWDYNNLKNARAYAEHIVSVWEFNYTVIDEFLEGKLQTQEYYQVKTAMDKILQYTKKKKLTDKDVAVVNVSFVKFIQYGGEKLVKEGLPNFLKFVASFRKFFGI